MTTRRTASAHVKADKARRDRALLRPELGTNGGTHIELRPAGPWSMAKVVDEATRKMIDEAIRRREARHA